ncbi:hypothetical protein Salat_1466500 [Sesamum alatum]|uniref:Endonuclease/exonuclease/phosphatase domain-containing protein n=1 Tax=Sesamum alatum TaxID=300844 RepID=A0AAE2CLV8_9LAMI|nr:hypothetical protein Salat_1466500 [Sesamum alatum]
MSDFHDAIADCALVDAGYIGSPYTWYSRRLRQRLDRVLVLDCWVDVFPKMQVTHLELSKSDHRGLLVEADYTEVLLAEPVVLLLLLFKRFDLLTYMSLSLFPLMWKIPKKPKVNHYCLQKEETD